MGFIADEIRQTIRQTGLAIKEQYPPAAEIILQQVVQHYANGTYSGSLWKDLAEPAAVQDPEAWRWVADFVGAEPAILFFDKDEEEAAFEVRGGDVLTALLAETFGFEFYVTDSLTSYLLCFNHHDYLIAAGRAVAWLERKAEKV